MSMGKHPFPVWIMFWRAMMTYIIVLYIILLGGFILVVLGTICKTESFQKIFFWFYA
jgi:hypothetical protein